jgi:hypothetical protein
MRMKTGLGLGALALAAASVVSISANASGDNPARNKDRNYTSGSDSRGSTTEMRDRRMDRSRGNTSYNNAPNRGVGERGNNARGGTASKSGTQNATGTPVGVARPGMVR